MKKRAQQKTVFYSIDWQRLKWTFAIPETMQMQWIDSKSNINTHTHRDNIHIQHPQQTLAMMHSYWYAKAAKMKYGLKRDSNKKNGEIQLKNPHFLITFIMGYGDRETQKKRSFFCWNQLEFIRSKFYPGWYENQLGLLWIFFPAFAWNQYLLFDSRVSGGEKKMPFAICHRITNI